MRKRKAVKVARDIWRLDDADLLEAAEAKDEAKGEALMAAILEYLAGSARVPGSTFQRDVRILLDEKIPVLAIWQARELAGYLKKVLLEKARDDRTEWRRQLTKKDLG